MRLRLRLRLSVPVLSKKACVILPAMGTRKGSVQKTCAFMSAWLG